MNSLFGVFVLLCTLVGGCAFPGGQMTIGWPSIQQPSVPEPAVIPELADRVGSLIAEWEPQLADSSGGRRARVAHLLEKLYTLREKPSDDGLWDEVLGLIDKLESAPPAS